MESYNALIEERFLRYFQEKEWSGQILSELEIVSAAVASMDDGVLPEDWDLEMDLLRSGLQRLQEQMQLTLIFLTDRQGTSFLATEPYRHQIESIDFSVREYLQKSGKGQQNWSPLFYSDVTQQKETEEQEEYLINAKAA